MSGSIINFSDDFFWRVLKIHGFPKAALPIITPSHPEIPVTVKMRAGWDQNSLVSTEAGVRMEKIGVAAITLHPRTTKQQFSGMSNWKLIKELKDAVKIPVIGNGDVKTSEDYNKMKAETGCYLH